MDFFNQLDWKKAPINQIFRLVAMGNAIFKTNESFFPIQMINYCKKIEI